MILFDAFVRFTGVGLLALLASFSLRDLRAWQGAPYLFFASVTVLAAYLGMTIEPLQLPYVPHFIVRFADIPHLVFVWLFALSIFQQKFELRWYHIAVGVIYSLPIFIVRLYQFGFVNWRIQPLVYAVEFFSLALMAHLIFATLRGRADDLLEKRRRARIYFVVVIVFVALSATLVEATGAKPFGMSFQTLWIASIWPGIVWTCYWLLKANRDALNFGDTRSVAQPVSARDRDLLSALERIMRDEQAYRAPDLKITTLARRMAITQHRLRALINETLGFQNFNSFVNSYRVSAVKNALQDPDKADVSILTLALDCGFNSISPFNRAFRESENMTPSEFRRSLSE